MDYTPAPWKTHAVNYINGTPAQWEIRDTRQGVIAITENLNPDDAALIAAAPDLLAALQGLIALADKVDPEGLFRGLEDIRARKAVAKATQL
jgi:hypothetical protein